MDGKISLGFHDLTMNQAFAILAAARDSGAQIGTFQDDEAPRAAEIAGQSVAYTENGAPIATEIAAPTWQMPASTRDGDVDSAGIAWDGKVHAGTKRKNANGSWAVKKGADETAAARYRAQFAAGVRAETTAANVMNSPSPAALNAKFQAPPVPQSFAAPAIDYVTWVAQYQAVYGKFNDENYGAMFNAAGVTEINDFVDNAQARQISYGIMKQMELA